MIEWTGHAINEGALVITHGAVCATTQQGIEARKSSRRAGDALTSSSAGDQPGHNIGGVMYSCL